MSNKAKTVFALSEAIKQRRQEITELEAQLAVAESEPVNYALARELHKITCYQNHTDGCGWYYEVSNDIDDWNGQSHRPYLHRANRLLAECERDGVEVEHALKYIKLIRGG